eukprot:SAG31_NODE_10540_length_1126_cov_13.897959_1_plen_38_part_10
MVCGVIFFSLLFRRFLPKLFSLCAIGAIDFDEFVSWWA